MTIESNTLLTTNFFMILFPFLAASDAKGILQKGVTHPLAKYL